jgi:hypothetical protein
MPTTAVTSLASRRTSLPDNRNTAAGEPAAIAAGVPAVAFAKKVA